MIFVEIKEIFIKTLTGVKYRNTSYLVKFSSDKEGCRYTYYVHADLGLHCLLSQGFASIDPLQFNWLISKGYHFSHNISRPIYLKFSNTKITKRMIYLWKTVVNPQFQTRHFFHPKILVLFHFSNKMVTHQRYLAKAILISVTIHFF